jgi:hopanoid biosynthesis associated RND transporter like protein HpnN
MLISLISKTVDASIRHAWLVIVASLALVVASAVCVSGHFAINTDIGRLIDTDAAWAKRDAALTKAFPQRGDLTLVVVQAPTPEFASQAARELAADLGRQPTLFRSAWLAGDSDFFAHNGLLFMPVPQVAGITQQLMQARPLLGGLAYDPSLRGLANLLSASLQGPLQDRRLPLGGMSQLLERSAETVEAVLAGRPAGMSWRALIDPGAGVQVAGAAGVAEVAGGGRVGRSFIEVRPLLDYSNLEPGSKAAEAIRAGAQRLRLRERYGAMVRLTGPTPLSDEEFSSVQEGAVLNSLVTLLIVVLILWAALRSAKLVFAVLATLIGGLAVTAALGLLLVGALNMISIAFAVLFVGIGVDFGIQFGVRFREEHCSEYDLHHALMAATRSIAMPLTLAAAATAASFLAFLPTEYRGVSELGEIAGVGIFCVAFPSCLTLLPALITVLRPTRGALMPGFAWLAPVDRLFEARRKPLLIGSLLIICGGLPLLLHLHFDFNPLHLKNPASESMQTLNSLKDSPEAGINNVSVLAPTLGEAQHIAHALEQVPEVGRVMTLASFIPDRQPEKIQLIDMAAAVLLPILQQSRQLSPAPAPDGERVAALRHAALALRNAAADDGPGAAQARRLSAALTALAGADAAGRDRADWALAGSLRLALGAMQQLLTPQQVSQADLPPELVHDWLAANGQAVVDVAPQSVAGGDPGDDMLLRKFAHAVLQAEPRAIGGPISVIASAHTIIRAFIEAAILAVLAITLLLWVALGRFGDVLRTIIPLLVSSAVTLELCVVFGISLNFANIIALPLLLGVGVAFKIYYVMAWRSGKTEMLQSGLTQAVILSACTTGTAFGSLWLSHHPGTSSMGELLALSLICTLIGAVLFQPILMGKPRAVPVQPEKR